MPEGYRPLSGREQAVLIALGAIIVLAVIDAFSQVSEMKLLDRVIAGEPVGDTELTANDARVGVLSLVQLVLYLVTAGLFIRWFHRAYRNLDALGAPRLHETWWAIGGWFIPIMALFRPLQIMDDIWSGTAPRGTPAGRASPLLRIWWLGFVASELVANFAFRRTLDGQDTAAQLKSADSLWLVSDVIDVIVAVLAILVVQRVSDRMEASAREPAEPTSVSFGPPMAPAI